MENKKDTIHGALGFTEKWRKKNQKAVNDEISNYETVSESMENSIVRIKTEEFGDGNYEPTEYEKKLFYSGYVMAQEMMERKQNAAKAAILSHMFMEMLGGNKHDDDE